LVVETSATAPWSFFVMGFDTIIPGPSRPTRTLQRQSDEQLAALVAAGSREAEEALAARYRGPLASYCGRVLSPEQGDWAAGRTLVDACASLREGLQPLRLRPWLFAVAVDVCRTRLRDGGAELPSPGSAD
jgi:DNA-directed RNA polymerase specialized sigma24 family protein